MIGRHGIFDDCTRKMIFFLFAGILFISGCATREPAKIGFLELDAASAIIVSARDGRVLYEKEPDKRLPPASTTKVLTAVVALENMPMDSRIKVSRNATEVTPTVAPLREDVSYSLIELIAAILVGSANDAAVAIAEGVSGSEEDFAKLMNETASRIGMENSYFERASGLPAGRPDRQYTTTRDLAVLMRYAMQYDILLEVLSRSKVNLTGSDGSSLSLTTKNRVLLWDDDAPWGKTGYTREARRTFVSVDGSMEPDIVFALLRSTSLWEDIRTLNRAGTEYFDTYER